MGKASNESPGRIFTFSNLHLFINTTRSLNYPVAVTKLLCFLLVKSVCVWNGQNVPRLGTVSQCGAHGSMSIMEGRGLKGLL